MTERPSGWTFLSNHGHVLVAVSRDPDVLVSDISERVGISDRATRGILRDLEAGGFITRRKVGRRNHYEIHDGGFLRHPEESETAVTELLSLFRGES